jgi:hypothetical protein
MLSVMLPNIKLPELESWVRDESFPSVEQLMRLKGLALHIEKEPFEMGHHFGYHPNPTPLLEAMTEQYAAAAEFLTVFGLPTVLPSAHAVGPGYDKWNTYITKKELFVDTMLARSIQHYVYASDETPKNDILAFRMHLPFRYRSATRGHSSGLNFMASMEIQQVLFPRSADDEGDIGVMLEQDAYVTQWILDHPEQWEAFDRAITYILDYHGWETANALRMFIQNEGKQMLLGKKDN